MTSKKLRKYLAYYQKTLRDEPDNIEARLRLAAIFRDMGRQTHAVEEYVTASKLLAREGLPLEAIAACKAVLELEPQHTETQLFLARLFARVPDAAGGSARIARPVEAEQSGVRRVSPNNGGNAVSSRKSKGRDEPITLSRPKSAGSVSEASADDPAVSVHEKETVVSSSGLVSTSSGDDEPTAVLGGPEHQDDARSTSEMQATDRESVLRTMASVNDADEADEKTDVRTTLDIGDDDILGEELLDGSSTPAGEDETSRSRRMTSPIAHESVLSRQERIETEHGLPSVGDNGPDTEEFEVDDNDDWHETFEVGVFDMDSLRLDRESTGDWDDLSFLDELDEPDTAEVAAAMGTPGESSLLSVSRADLPEIPLFSKLEPSVFMRLLQVMDLNEVPAGTSIVEPGRTERSLFVIVRGTAVVTRTLDDGTTVELATMGEGEFFGEFALLTGRSQMATVSAQTPMSLLEVRQDVLDLMAEEHPEIWNVLWDFYHARMLNNMLASSTIFRSLSDEQRHILAAKFRLEEVSQGELLLGEGEHDYDLYLICNGQVRVEREVGGGLPQELGTLREGEFVGLVSSAEEEPVVANLRATCDTTLLVLAGSEFRRILKQNPRIEREVNRTVRERKAIAGRYTSGVTDYAELGLAPHADSTD